jgi:hypothetical protein
MKSKYVFGMICALFVLTCLLLTGCGGGGSSDAAPAAAAAPPAPVVLSVVDVSANLAAHNTTGVPWATGTTSATRAGFDITWLDRNITGNRLYLANRGTGTPAAFGTGRIWVFNTTDDTIVPAGVGGNYFISGFQGTKPPGPQGQANHGPNGILVASGHDASGNFFKELWAGDGSGNVSVVNLTNDASPGYGITSTIATGGAYRADELAYDPTHDIIMIGVDQENGTNGGFTNPTLVFIDRHTKTVFPVGGRITYDGHAQAGMPWGTHWPLAPTFDLGGGMEQPVWDAPYYYQSVPFTTDASGNLPNGPGIGGEVDVIDPSPLRIGLPPNLVARYFLTGCTPAGLALGPSHHMIVACGDSVTGGGPKSIIFDNQTGTVLATITQVGGADMAWYNPGNSRYYIAAQTCPATAVCGGPVVGEIDALTNTWIRNIPTGTGAHVIAVDPDNDHIYVPISAANGVKVFKP